MAQSSLPKPEGATSSYAHESNATNFPQRPSKRNMGRVVVAGMSVVAVGVGLVGWRVVVGRALDSARESYTVAVGEEKTSLDALSVLAKESENLSVDCAAKVTETNLCEELSGVLEQAKNVQAIKALNVDEADKDTLDEAAKDVQANTKKADTVKTQLDDIAGKVKASIEAKQLADAKAGLEKVVNDAQTQMSSTETLLSASEGKVSDEATWQAASSALDEVKGLLEKAKSDVASEGVDAVKLNELATNLADKTGALTSAHAALQASHETWTQAQAAASAAQANRQNPRAGSGDSAGSGRASQTHKPSRRGNTGGASRPAQGTTGGSSGKSGNNGSTGGWVASETTECWTVRMDTKGNSVSVPCP